MYAPIAYWFSRAFCGNSTASHHNSRSSENHTRSTFAFSLLSSSWSLFPYRWLFLFFTSTRHLFFLYKKRWTAQQIRQNTRGNTKPPPKAMGLFFAYTHAIALEGTMSATRMERWSGQESQFYKHPKTIMARCSKAGNWKLRSQTISC